MKNFKMKCFSKDTKQKFKSCGDLTIYPIREIRGSNRILYGDKYDNPDYSLSSDPLIYSSHIYTEPFEPVYAEIKNCHLLRTRTFQNIFFDKTDEYQHYDNDCGLYEKLYHCYSQPSLNSDSCDSGYRSSIQEPPNKANGLIRVHQKAKGKNIINIHVDTLHR